MLASLVILAAFLVVAGCCVYISYRIGQVVSPTARALVKRIGDLEAGVARSTAHMRQALAQHRQDSAEETRRILGDHGKTATDHAGFVRRGLEDLGDRLNATRLDLVRDATRLREDIERTLASLRERAQEDAAALARMQSEGLAGLSARIAELGAAADHREERARAMLEGVGADLKAAYAAGAAELQRQTAVHLSDAREALARFEEAAAGQGARLGGVERTVSAAVERGAARQDALQAAVESRLEALGAHLAGQADRLLAEDERLRAAWARLEEDFSSIRQSLVQTSGAVEALKRELIVKVRDGTGAGDVGGLLARALQPDEFERDVEIEPGSGRRVPFAVRLSDNPLTRTWLPVGVLPAIPAFDELVSATVFNDAESVRRSSEAFERAILAAAEDLSVRFICPPRTQNLAVLLVPMEDVLEEIQRRDSLVDAIRRSWHVVVAGPSTLPTLLTGLRTAFMGTTAAPRAGNGHLGTALAADGD